MELKEYIAIFRKNANLFWSVVFLVVIAAFAFTYSQPERYDSSLALNITRTGVQKTDQFRYDDFYRLQADEKFTETVVEWLKSPGIVKDIYRNAGIDASRMSIRQLGKVFSPEKMSSQLILVSFSSSDANTSKKIYSSVMKVLNDSTDALNKDQQDDGWFRVIAEEPVVAKHIIDWKILFSGSFIFGIFVAFWAVMIKHYFSQS